LDEFGALAMLTSGPEGPELDWQRKGVLLSGPET